MKTNFNTSRFSSPVLGEEAISLYKSVYGDNGEKYIEILEESPYEVAVNSRMLAYLAKITVAKKEEI